MKKVLIALDYDAAAQTIAEQGYALAKALGATTLLLHVVADPAYYSSEVFYPIMGFAGFMNIDPMRVDVMKDIKTDSYEFLDKTKQHLGDDTIQTLVVEGDFGEAIIDTIKEQQADILVIGSHSKRWLATVLTGSLTETIMHHTEIPLYIIPTKNAAS
jgi:nucleotide-binding universal stress UspA family protein